MISSALDRIAAYREALQHELQALQALYDRADESVEAAIALLAEAQGQVVCVGMGKCGIVAQKIVATFVSTGTPAAFMHPAEALHGDLGHLQAGDVLLMLSNSGETPEILALLPHVQALEVPVITMTGRPGSSLAQQSRVVLNTAVAREADPLDLAPTASTTAMLAAGDALAAVLMRLRGFEKRDYARYHPGGSLGQKLLCRVEALMHSGEQIPAVQETTLLREALLVMSAQRLGAVFVLSPEQRLAGIFTDGDLRRLFQCNPEPLELPIHTVMVRDPKTTTDGTLAVDALRCMEDNLITILPVLDAQGMVVGALHIHDLIRAGIQ